MRTRHTFGALALALAVFGSLEGCAPAGAQLCRRDPLVHPEVRFDEHGNRLVIDDHVYFSKEGTPSGRGAGGGGCGCN